MKTLNDEKMSIKQNKYANIDIDEILQGDKKVVAFLGASKSGTSFIVNNIAAMVSNRGINVALLDATQNKGAYYIYTKNQERLRKIAFSSIENLANGVTDGIKVNNNLTVYTTMPGENKYMNEVEPILETLIKNHSLILIDCDFTTPENYFKYAQEIYLVQSMDVLSIQPLTEALLKLEERKILDESKLRIIINKFVEVESITIKDILGGVAFYNDPNMYYMKQLFDKNMVKYLTIPFREEVYEIYIEQVANCNIKTQDYDDEILAIFKQLSRNIFPFQI